MMNAQRPARRLGPFGIGGLTAAVAVATLAAGPVAPAGSIKLSSLPTHLSDSVANRIFSWVDTAPGTPSTEFTASAGPAVAATEIDLPTQTPPAGPCTPTITKLKGNLTSGGDIALNGTCFGQSGSVHLGGFPNGEPHLTTLIWTPTAIAVQLPKISGVPDLTMHVTVSTGALSSKPVDARFIAALGDPVDLPSKDFKNVGCGMAGVCSSGGIHLASGNHWDYHAESGTDEWLLTVPDHFRLTAIELVHVKNGPTKTATVLSSADQTAFTVNWQESNQPNGDLMGITGTIVYTCQQATPIYAVAGQVPTCDDGSAPSVTKTIGSVPVPTYNNVYRLVAKVVGPAGMNP